MKKKMIPILVTSVLCIISTMPAVVLAVDQSNKTAIDLAISHRQERLAEKIELIRQKAGTEVKTKVQDKIKAKQEKVADDKKVTEKQVTEQNSSEQVAPAAEVTTSASQRGREKGQRNREYGEQLNDPNLSPAERQQIIQEKKDYNRGH